MGILGNEHVDIQVNSSFTLDQTNYKIHFSNLKPYINKSWINGKLHGGIALITNFLR